MIVEHNIRNMIKNILIIGILTTLLYFTTIIHFYSVSSFGYQNLALKELSVIHQDANQYIQLHFRNNVVIYNF